MKIVVVNMGDDDRLTADGFARMVDAVQRQIAEHFAPFWQTAPLPLRAVSTPADVRSDEFPILVSRTPDIDDALGYHAPSFGRVFTGPTFDHGGTALSGANSVSATLSHEVLETQGDPYANFWALRDDGKLEPIEIADRTEGDVYEIDGVSVSNFLGPRAFRPGPAGPFDWLGLLRSPGEVRDFGYVTLWTPGEGDPANVYGARFPEWKRRIKEAPRGRKLRRFRAGAPTQPDAPNARTRVGR